MNQSTITGNQFRNWLWATMILVPFLYLAVTRGTNYAYDNGYSSVWGQIVYKQNHNPPSTSPQNTNDEEVRSSPAPNKEATIQIYCDITTGKWSPGYNDHRNLQKEWYPSDYTASAASSQPGRRSSPPSSSVFRSLSSKQNEEEIPAQPHTSSSTKLSSATNSNSLLNVMRTPNWYSLMDDHTRRQYAWLTKRRYHSENILYIEKNWTNYSIDIEDNNNYPGLSVLNEMWGIYDESKNGVSKDKPPNPSSVWLWPFTELWPMPSYVGVGNQADKLFLRNDNNPSSPMDQLRTIIGDRSFLRTNPIHNHFPPLNTSKRTGKHMYDSLQINTTIDKNKTYVPYVTPLFTFRLTTSTLNKLRSSELRTVRLGMQRTCAAMHTSWQGRLLETVNDFYGTFRDNGCDISCEYNHENNACKYHGTRSIKKSDRSNFPIAVLSELIVHIDESDEYSFPSTASSPSKWYESIPLPYVAQDESYAVHIDTTHIISNTKHAPDSVTVPVYSLEGHIHAPFLWGSLYGLETFNQIVENWGNERIGVPTDEQFTSPIFDILTGKRTIPQSYEAIELANAASSHVSPQCVTKPPISSDTFNQNKKFNDYMIPPLVTLPLLILDQPWKRWRGLSLDTSRHWLPVESILTILDGMGYTKMNVLHWHFSDAQSFPFLLDSHPEIAMKGAWSEDKIYTRKDIILIIKYAARRGIRVVPEMDSPAHAAALGKSHSEVLVDCSSIAGGNLKLMDLYSLDPSQEKTFELITDIFKELGSLFPDKYFHIGADEVAPECWASDSRVREWSRSNLDILYKALPSGLLNDVHATYAVLLAYFLHRIHNIIIDMGKFAVSWEDSFEKLHSTIRSRRLFGFGNEEETNSVPLNISGIPYPESSKIPKDHNIPSINDWNKAGTLLYRVLQEYSHTFPDRSRSGVSFASPSGTEQFDTPRKIHNIRTLEKTSVLPPNFPLPLPKKGIKYLPQTIIEGWKCWVHHADDVVLAGAQTYTHEVENFYAEGVEHFQSEIFHPFLHKNDTSFLYYIENFGVLQASCWYLDYSSPWGDYYKHWPLPEHSHGITETTKFHDRLSSFFVNYTKDFINNIDENLSKNSNHVIYPKAIFGKTPHLGGEAAMWTERVDTTVLFCRVWPRAGIIGEVTWSESLVYDRYARYYGQDPPFNPSTWYPRSDDTDKLVSLYAAPRYLGYTRRLLRRRIPSSATAVFDVGPSTASSSSLGFNDFSILKIPAQNFETDLFPFNSMCPGIEQTIQRNKSRLVGLLDRSLRTTGDGVPEDDAEFDDNFFVNYDNNIISNHKDNNIYYTKNFTFVSWNIHDGGGSHNRYQQIIEYLRSIDADVVGLVEANGWENSVSRQLRSKSTENIPRTMGNDIGINQKPLDILADKFGDLVPENTDSVLQGKVSEPLNIGIDEVLYRDGKTLDSIVNPSKLTVSMVGNFSTYNRNLYEYIDTSGHVTQQTAGFRRRAANAGYTYSHILRLPSGYHLALLSVRPMTVVYEDTEHFERGILVADIYGIRFMLIHLHAQSATERFRETQWIAELIKQYNTAGLPLVILGDFNTLSPFDALCHRSLNTIDRLEGTDVPLYLRTKYLCHYDNDEDCVHQKVFSGTDQSKILQIDYRPMFNILDALYDNFIPSDHPEGYGTGVLPFWTLPSPTTRIRPSYDLDFTLWYYNHFDRNNYTEYHDNETNTTFYYPKVCLASYPTSALGKNADDAGENGMVPLKIDHVVGNRFMYNLLLPYHVQCYVGNAHPTEHPISHLLEMSDHLPVVCKVE